MQNAPERRSKPGTSKPITTESVRADSPDVLAHTPTPWDCTGGDIWIDTREQVCCGRGYQECCGEPDVIGGQELVAQTSAVNAAFIVKSVNAHDKLVKALRECAIRCRYDGDLFHDQGNEMRMNASWKAADLANAVLASIRDIAS